MPELEKNKNFIEEIIEEDIAAGKNEGRIATRFPPEPNGYLHIGHAKSICLNFSLAQKYNGTCNLRFDDTNPDAEEVEYVESIKEDIGFLGFKWDGPALFTSDYFEKLYEFAVFLIKKRLAYIDNQNTAEIRQNRGNYNVKGINSPYRNRSIDENTQLFERMKAGKLEEGECVLRAKIDMESSNMNMRDPILYRIRKSAHHRTGTKWCIYPMYDFAHGQSDAIEKITHSICTLEFENHRPLYDWFLKALEIGNPPRQFEFARLNMSYTVMSKRKLAELVKGGYVSGWDDPRMPTISGLRRRGYTPKSIRTFCDSIGVAKRENTVDVALLEHCVREDLNETAPRVMGVLKPLKIVITNYPEDKEEEFDAPVHPMKPEMGSRKVLFAREIFIERDDFLEDPPKKWFRLSPGREIRLRYACLITCNEVIRDEKTDKIVELHCTWDPESRGGGSPDGRKVKGTSHWVSAKHAIPAEVRLYDRLFNVPNPLGESDFIQTINPDSCKILKDCLVEPSLASAKSEERYQFERLGYFCVDKVDSKADHLVFNRIVPLRDTWAKVQRSMNKSKK